jgi:hypothetical protein
MWTNRRKENRHDESNSQFWQFWQKRLVARSSSKKPRTFSAQLKSDLKMKQLEFNLIFSCLKWIEATRYQNLPRQSWGEAEIEWHQKNIRPVTRTLEQNKAAFQCCICQIKIAFLSKLSRLNSRNTCYSSIRKPFLIYFSSYLCQLEIWSFALTENCRLEIWRSTWICRPKQSKPWSKILSVVVVRYFKPRNSGQ